MTEKQKGKSKGIQQAWLRNNGAFESTVEEFEIAGFGSGDEDGFDCPFGWLRNWRVFFSFVLTNDGA